MTGREVMVLVGAGLFTGRADQKEGGIRSRELRAILSSENPTASSRTCAKRRSHRITPAMHMVSS